MHITPSKIALFNYDALKDRKTGIKELADVYDKLEIEFKPQTEELKLMSEEIKKMEDGFKYVTGPPRPGDLTIEMINSRIKEYELAVSKLKSKKEEVKFLYEKRELELTADIKKKIAEAAKLFAKERGYDLILNISKLNETFILAKSDNADVTEEFIQFCNDYFEKKKSQ